MKTALVVDESPRWRGAVADALREQGWAVTTAGTLEAEAGGADLAVLEWAPDPASEAALRAYLDAPDNQRTRYVLLTPRPVGESDLRQHSAVLGVLDKSQWNLADLLALTAPAAEPDEPSSAPPATDATGPKVLVVEDDANWRAIYAELLTEVGYVPYFAVSYGEARGWLQHETFELAIVDLNLASSAAPSGNRDGFFLLRAAKQRGVPAMVVSALGDPDDIDRAYDEFSIFTFVEKEGFDRRNFGRLLEAAWRSRTPAPATADATEETPTLIERLTPREREVLALLTQGLTNRQIAEALLISANTTKKHVDHILQKLGASTRAGAVALAMGSKLNTGA